MKQSDPVMQEVWQDKEANVEKFQNLATYMANLRKQAKQTHTGGRVAVSTAASS